ncbi:MAG TPA: NAD(+) synthase [Steroidobacter sp.]|uniref:NAD(+) synthase n=1 Tax=Steroidobacter sp. TaxID=1978227 RepID=UPI002EDAFCBE
MSAAFYDIHSHGLVRIASCTPRVEVGNPARNLQQTVELARLGHEQHVDLMLFPELGLSAYAIDDLFLQDALLQRVEDEIKSLLQTSETLHPVLIVGAPVRRSGRVYNCAVVIHRGQLLGVVPKSFLPNYREYYEKRWFAAGVGTEGLAIELAGQTTAFGVDLIFACRDVGDFIFHVEICEDFWAATPPSTQGALAGALILCNLSASNIVVGKADERAVLCASQSVRCQAAYVYSAAGPGESTTDLAWDGQASIHELGMQLACTERFPLDSQMTIADVDVERLRLERMRTPTFNDAVAAAGHPERRFRRIAFSHARSPVDVGLKRPIDRFPFVPDDPARLDRDCYETFNIQAQGLIKRLQATGIAKITIGVSGGLDSTHALLVAAKAFDLMRLPRSNILGFTFPGFATSEHTKKNAWALMRALNITAEEIDITPMAKQMLADLKHPYAAGEQVFDVTFENVQAGLRTDYLFRLANQRNALVLGTSDLSELALGWCTYGVGDHMSHYNVNGSLAKTMIQHLVRWVIGSGQFDAGTSQTLRSILETKISPELVPGKGAALQSTEAKIGPYELQDFNLYYITRFGLRPSKIAFLAWHAWKDVAHGAWPEGMIEGMRRSYQLQDVKHWLQVFLRRFFTLSQFKRSALPNGPKVMSGGNLSPRGDWRAPSDGNATIWLEELEQNVP